MSLPPLKFDPSDRNIINDPFPVLDRLQREAPIHWSDTARCWIVTRYDDCKAVLMDKRGKCRWPLGGVSRSTRPHSLAAFIKSRLYLAGCERHGAAHCRHCSRIIRWP